jgi:hypothetical protein
MTLLDSEVVLRPAELEVMVQKFWPTTLAYAVTEFCTMPYAERFFMLCLMLQRTAETYAIGICSCIKPELFSLLSSKAVKQKKTHTRPPTIAPALSVNSVFVLNPSAA